MSKSFIVTITLLVVLGAILLIPIFVNPIRRDGPRNPEERFHNDTAGIETGMDEYLAAFGSFPTGNTEKNFKILSGNNAKQLSFLRHSRTNAMGEWLDWWRTPYQIKIVATTNFIIQSAGSNKIFGDADDIIFNSVSNDFVKP